MPVSPIPAGYHTVTPYVSVPDARKAIDFLKRAFGAETTETLSEDSDCNIRHAEIKIGDSMLMLVRLATSGSPGQQSSTCMWRIATDGTNVRCRPERNP